MLRTLELANCARLTDEGIKALALGCPKLEMLDLSFCKNVTSVGMEWLCGNMNAEGCNELRVIRLVETAVSGSGTSSLLKRFKYIEILD